MMQKLLPVLLCDFYKISHKDLYDTESAIIYSTWTPRKSRLKGINKVVVFGLQGFIKKYLIEYFNDNFFSQDINEIIHEYERILKNTLNLIDVDTTHIEKLHSLGYLPIRIDALEEGTLCPIRVPMFTIQNTLPEFYWITNFLETLISTEIWKPMTSATIALQYKTICSKWARKTCDNMNHIPYQLHDFSMRGMSSVDTACTSGAAHLTVAYGTDTIPAICYLEKYYNADVTKGIVGTSIPATEHSIMEFNSYGKEKDEYEAFKRIITKVHPNGFVSIVSDTWNLWHVLTHTLPRLKSEILQRDGKVVIRPDSGDPVDIICGLNTKDGYRVKDGVLEQINGEVRCSDGSSYWFEDRWEPVISEYTEEPAKGVIELLWDIFGGTVNSKGYKVLDPHIGCIYGDAITLERAEEICKRLEQKGFASSNIVFGIGSYTYNMNTRDTFGFALKTTFAIQGDKEMLLYKDPITDSGEKKSQRGMVHVGRNCSGELCYSDGLDSKGIKEGNVGDNLLQPLFIDGKLLKETSLDHIRFRINENCVSNFDTACS